MSDIGFKHVFGREANKEILITFLNEVLPDRKITDIEHIRNEQIPLNRKSKKSVYDVYCKITDGTRVIVEVQHQEQFDYVDRTLYYNTFPIQNQLDKGMKPYTLCPVYSVNILNFGLKELEGLEQVKTVFRLRELESGTVLSNKYTFIFIELSKFNKTLGEIAEDNLLEKFYYCLKHIKYLDERPLELQQEIFEKLFIAARMAKMNKKEQAKYIKAMITERDRYSQLLTAELRGQEKGRAEGRAEGRDEGIVIGVEKGRSEAILEAARNFKNQNVPVEVIAACTGLTIECIQKL